MYVSTRSVLLMDLAKMFEIYIVFIHWGPSPWAPWGPYVPFLATLDLLPLRMIPTKFSWNLIISFEEKYQNKNFPCSPPPPSMLPPYRAPMGPPTEMPWTTVHSSSREVSTHYMYVSTRSVLLPNLEKKMFEIYIVFTLGGPAPGPPWGLHMYHFSNFGSLTPKDDSYQVWMKSDHFLLKKNTKINISLAAPPPPPACYPHRSPMGPPTEMPWTTLILHLERYLHTIYQVCPTSRSGEEDVWNLHSFYPWGPSPWGPLGATCTILATSDLLPLRMIPTKFGWNLTMHFGEEDENVKSLRTTDDARRTTDDGRRTPDKKRSQ